MPGRVCSTVGSFDRRSGKMTRNIVIDGQSSHNGVVNGNFYQRKQEERSIRDKHLKQFKLDSYLADDENFPCFKMQLGKMGLHLRDIPADGNCLFRALGDQFEGHCRNHFMHRADVANFMRMNRLDFEPFVEDDVAFDDHLRNLQRLGTHAGNDAIVAFAKLHGLTVVIHQLNGKPLLISGAASSNDSTRQLHIAYHNGDHYSSVRKIDDNTESPAHIQIQDSAPCSNPSQRGKEPCTGIVSAHRGLEDIENEVIMATNCTDISRVRQSLVDCEYDVDASIADLLQQLELTSPDADTTSLASQSTITEKTNDLGSVNGKGHKVHFRDNSYGGSSGYGSLSSNPGGGARPKLNSTEKVSSKKIKTTKKLEKKKRAEDRHREKYVNGSVAHYAPHVSSIIDGTVMDHRQAHVIAVPNGKFTSI